MIEGVGSPYRKEDIPDLANVKSIQIREDETNRLDKAEQHSPHEPNPQLQNYPRITVKSLALVT